MVERYLIKYDERGEVAHPSGDFVHYSDYARLQEQMETLTRELASEKISASAWADSARINLHRAEASVAERDRLREAGAYYIDRLKAAWAGKPVRDMGEAESAWRAALQKEPQP